MGRDCAIRDYRNFSVNKIYKKDVPLSSFSSTALTSKEHAKKGHQKDAKNKSDDTVAKKNTDESASTIKLRGVPISPYLMKKEEKEGYKILHQLEFNSFRTQALESAKDVANMQYDYYYESSHA